MRTPGRLFPGFFFFNPALFTCPALRMRVFFALLLLIQIVDLLAVYCGKRILPSEMNNGIKNIRKNSKINPE
jgi:hypothetical protein